MVQLYWINKDFLQTFWKKDSSFSLEYDTKILAQKIGNLIADIWGHIPKLIGYWSSKVSWL
jgi:hypothetical protein